MPTRTMGAAFQSLLEGLGVPVYAEASVPKNAKYPLATYSLAVAPPGSQAVSTVQLWAKGSEAEANDLAHSLWELLGTGGALARFDGGIVWALRGEPFWTAVDSGEKGVKRRACNVVLEVLGDD